MTGLELVLGAKIGEQAANKIKEKMQSFETATIPVKIRRYYTDVDGVILDKNTVNPIFKQNFPVFLWGSFDMSGGYRLANQAFTAPVNFTFFETFTYGVGQPFLSFTGFNNIKSQLNKGDLVTIYADDIENPNLFVWIVQSVDYCSVASIYKNSGDFNYMIDFIDYFSDNQNQWDKSFKILNISPTGNLHRDSVQPYIFKNAYTVQNNFIRVKINTLITQYKLIGFDYLFQTDDVNVEFNVKILC